MENDKCYCVYLHRCPNEKVYVGISKNYESRWRCGSGYKDNNQFFSDIQKFGWENIEHKILISDLTISEAKNYESMLILAYDSENPKKGYNRTSIKRELLKLEQDSKSIEKKKIEKNNRVLEEFKIDKFNAFRNGLEWFGLFTKDEISQLKYNEAKTISVYRLFCISEQFRNKMIFKKEILYPDYELGIPPYKVYRIGEQLFVDELYRDYLICLFEFYSEFFER